jgi:hypothetical protein
MCKNTQNIYRVSRWLNILHGIELSQAGYHLFAVVIYLLK